LEQNKNKIKEEIQNVEKDVKIQGKFL